MREGPRARETAATASPARGSVRLRAFSLWLVIFYAAWLFVVSSHGAWSSVWAHWPIALAMLFGSYLWSRVRRSERSR